MTINFKSLIERCDYINCRTKKKFVYKKISQLYDITTEQNLTDFGFESDAGHDELVQDRLTFIELLLHGH